MWFQAYGPNDEPNQIKVSIAGAQAGDFVGAHTALSPGLAAFHIVDMDTGFDGHYTYSNSIIRADGHSAFILERTEEGSTLPPLANVGTVEFTSAQSAYGGYWYNAGGVPYGTIAMTDCSPYTTTVLADFNSWFGSTAFTVTRYAEGHSC